ncbi:hypothetical protein JCM10908_006897 [Rhodotorula pacifica]|uniref:uncharacterized protein n=1 Tax=Rhodotorula pacifica TaxID=1495444 RepID=UPI00316BB466
MDANSPTSSPGKVGRGHGAAATLPPAAANTAPTGPAEQSPTLAEHPRTGEWAPAAPPFEDLPPSGLPHLPAATPTGPRKFSTRLHGHGPPITGHKAGGALTSSPFTVALSPAQASLSYSLSRLLSLPRFAAFLHTPLGYAQFAAYLAGSDPQNQSLQELELWKDTYVLSQFAQQTEAGARGISNVYLSRDDGSTFGPDLPDETRRTLFEALSQRWAGLPKLDSVSKHLLESLYRKEFEGFIKTRLVRHTQAQLAKYNLKPEERGGIGSSFILTNPRLRDDPIVLVSPGFCELTGYTPNQIIGRNCRFLQGKATDPKAVNTVRQKLTSGSEVLQLVLNYRADGTPFMNLLHVMPLRDLDGNLSYFLGGQASITTALTTGTDLSLIIPEDENPPADMSAFSPAVQLEARNPGQQWVLPPPRLLSPPITASPVEGESSRRPSEGQLTTSDAIEDEGLSVHKLCFFPARFIVAFKRLIGLEKKKPTTAEEGLVLEKGAEAKKTATETAPKHGELVPASQKDMRTMTLEQRLLDIQVTYDRLVVIKRASREILFTSASFLRSLGLPGTTRQEIDRSPLIYQDILELLVAPSAPVPNSTATKELRANVKSALADAIPCNFECGFQFRGGPRYVAAHYKCFRCAAA